MIINNKKYGRKRCLSMRNTYSMKRCERLVTYGRDICEVHKRRKILYLTTGSTWDNKNNSNSLLDCKKSRDNILFWEVLSNGCVFDKLNTKYRPVQLSYLRIEKISYLKKELKRLDVSDNLIDNMKIDRYYWFTNLIYYLANFQSSVKKIQNFYREIIKKKIEKKKKSVKIIWKYYLRYILFKKLPRLVKNGKFLNENNCINIQDPISQDNFVDVNIDRWVICKDKNSTKSWWFDLSSAIQLLGYPGSHAGENPFNRKVYPSDFLFDIEEKIKKVKNKYDDISYLLFPRNELKCLLVDESKIPPCYSYDRFKIHIKSNRLFKSFNEFGYEFPREIFIKYSLGEVRLLLLKLYKYVSLMEDRKRFFPKFNTVFTRNFVISIPNYTDTTLLKNKTLNILLDFVTNQEDYDDRITCCLKTLFILGEINEESHYRLHFYNLCECKYLSQSMISRFSVSNPTLNTTNTANTANNTANNTNTTNTTNIDTNTNNMDTDSLIPDLEMEDVE